MGGCGRRWFLFFFSWLRTLLLFSFPSLVSSLLYTGLPPNYGYKQSDLLFEASQTRRLGTWSRFPSDVHASLPAQPLITQRRVEVEEEEEEKEDEKKKKKMYFSLLELFPLLNLPVVVILSELIRYHCSLSSLALSSTDLRILKGDEAGAASTRKDKSRAR